MIRRLVDAVTLLAVLALLGGLVVWHLDREEQRRKIGWAHAEVQRFESMLRLRSVTKDVELNERGWPVTIDPAWFKDNPPRNTLLTPDRPWVEVAPPEQQALMDPPMRIAIDNRSAGYWYNPYQGIVRALVPVAINDVRTLELYNQVNGTDLDSIYSDYVPGAPATAAADEDPPGR